MRRRNEVWCVEQRRTGCRFLDKHVERRPADMAAVEPGLQRRFVDQPTPGAVDDADALLGLGEIVRRQDVAGAVGQRRVQRDEIRPGQQIIEHHLFNAEVLRALRRQERIIGDDLHLQTQRAVGDDRADIARADQPQRLAGEFDPHEAVLLPLASLGRGIGLRQLAGEREHQRNGMFRRGDRIAKRGVHHHNAARGCRRNIDIVDANPGPADDLQVGGRGQYIFGRLGGGADGKAVIIADDGDQLVLGQPGFLMHLNPPRPENFGSLGGHFVGDQNFWHGIAPWSFLVRHPDGSQDPIASGFAAGDPDIRQDDV